VADLTHLMAELVENAVHFSPPEASVIIRTRPYLQTPGAHVLTVEDWGVGMRAEDMAAANEVLTAPQEVDLSVSQRLGLHVVARLAQRHGIEASLTPTPGNGVTAAVVLPASLFSDPDTTPDTTPDELLAGEAEVPSRVVPAALAAAVMPATDLPPTPAPPVPPPPAPPPPSTPAPPVPPSWAPAERWADLTEEPAGNGNGDRNGDGDDWSGWWEPSPGDLEGAEPMSPLAARPPLSERVQASASGAWEPHPPAVGAPEREGSRQPGGVPAAVHSPQTGNPLRPAPVAADDAGPEELLLSRRVPQAHLAPELRRHGREGTTAGPDDALPDAAEARAALSRYQASRQAAKAAVDDGGAGEAGPEPPPAGGGWS
jgi:hypothetical protein